MMLQYVRSFELTSMIAASSNSRGIELEGLAQEKDSQNVRAGRPDHRVVAVQPAEIDGMTRLGFASQATLGILSQAGR